MDRSFAKVRPSTLPKPGAHTGWQRRIWRTGGQASSTSPTRKISLTNAKPLSRASGWTPVSMLPREAGIRPVTQRGQRRILRAVAGARSGPVQRDAPAGLPTDTEKPGTAMATQVSTGVQVRELPGPERSLRVMAKGGGDPYRNRCGAVFRVPGPGGRLGDGCKANCRMTLWRPALRQSESQAGPPAP